MKGSVVKRPRGPNAKKKKRDTTKLCMSPPKISFRDPIGHELPSSLQNFRWSADKVERKLQEKIQEKTQVAGNFVYQQAYRLLEGNRGEGIDFPSFREQLRIKFGIILDDSELQLLFDKYDEDGNGTIDIHEFIRRVLPPDYNYGRQWFEVSQLEGEERASRLRHEARQEFLACQGLVDEHEVKNTGDTSHWTIETLKKQIQAKVVQKTPSGEDQYRRAFKMLRSGRDQGIMMNGLQFNLKTKFGIYASDEQMRQLFSMCDQDSNGEIDLKEFLQFVDPPAYPMNSKVPQGIWTRGDSEDENDDDDWQNERNESRVFADTRVYSKESRPASARVHPGYQGSVSSTSSIYSEDSNHTPTRTRKQRPKTADPRKTYMLQQRREMVERQRRELMQQQRMKNASTCQHCQPMSSMSMGDIHVANLEALSLAGGQYENCARPPDRYTSGQCGWQRGSVSSLSEIDSTSISGRCGKGYISRPRSAGSVRSYASSSVGSVSSSVRGAAYMKRPSTAQSLRQKCLESRGVSPMAAEAHANVQMKKRAAMEAAQVGTDQKPQRTSCVIPRDAERRHSYSEVSPGNSSSVGVCTCSCCLSSASDDEGCHVPRIVHVHAKQYSSRPYTSTPEGRLRYRRKV